MKIAISTASSYSDTLKYSLESVGQQVEILNSWGQRDGLKKIISNPENYKSLLLQWPEALLKNSELYSLNESIIKEIHFILQCIQDVGIKIIFIFHNLTPHEFAEQRIIDKIFYTSILNASSIIIHHSKAGLKKSIREYPILKKKRNIIFRHPPYYFVKNHQRDAKLVFKLCIDTQKKYFLAIGTIAQYKNIGLFIQTLEKLNRKKYGLIIAGKCYDNTLEIISPKLKSLVKNGYDIKLLNYWLSDMDISTLIQVSDYLICNNKDTLTSGIPHLCEAGGKILYSDVRNDYLNEISNSYLISMGNIGNSIIERHLINSLKTIYDQNNPEKAGAQIAQVIYGIK